MGTVLPGSVNSAGKEDKPAMLGLTLNPLSQRSAIQSLSNCPLPPDPASVTMSEAEDPESQATFQACPGFSPSQQKPFLVLYHEGKLWKKTTGALSFQTCLPLFSFENLLCARVKVQECRNQEASPYETIQQWLYVAPLNNQAGTLTTCA